MTSGVAAAQGGGDIITMGDVTATRRMCRRKSWCSSNQRAKGELWPIRPSTQTRGYRSEMSFSQGLLCTRYKMQHNVF